MFFWIIVIALSISVASVIGLAGLRARGQSETAGATDVPVYRAQLVEVERDLARGVIAGDEGDRLRNEISRRLLAADAAARNASAAAGRAGPVALGLLGVIVVGGALGLYLTLGAPGYGDMALADRLDHAKEVRETRPPQSEAEADMPAVPAPEVSEEFQTLMERLRTAVADRPDDLRGLRLLARNEAALNNFKAAYTAQEQILALLGDKAEAQDYLDYAELLIVAAGGYVSPQAEASLRAALARDAANGAAQYYVALMWRQTGRPDVAFRIWDRLLRKGPEDAAWIPPIRAQIDEAAALAGVDYDQPRPSETLAGPSAEDIEASKEMSAQDRQDMIRGMVSRLSERLASQGGSAEEWARLIGAYGVLGESTRARAIRDEALQVFAGRQNDLALIEAAAKRAGLTE
ncbi:MAG: c-type cytochrome biogenesis protein CcmI [Pseudooceanicola sp.]